MFHLKIVAVGDQMSEKTALLHSYIGNSYPEGYVPVVFDNCNLSLEIDTCSLDVSLWDSTEDDSTRHLAYQHTDIFLLCFNLTSRKTFENVLDIWSPELKRHAPNVLIILVGTNLDVRDPATHVSKQEGIEMCHQIGAAYYFECSARIKQSVKNGFDNAIRIYIFRNKKMIPRKSWLGKVSLPLQPIDEWKKFGEEKNWEAVRVLYIQYPFLLNEQTFEVGTMLSWAVIHNQINFVQELLSLEDIDINRSNQDGITPLHWAAKKGFKEIVNILITFRKLQINSVNKNGESVLDFCSTTEMFSILLTRIDLDVNLLDNDGKTQLHKAAKARKHDIVKLLISHPNINAFILDKEGRLAVDDASGVSKIMIQGHINLRLALSEKAIQWNRSKIMLIGQGRAGKSALANNLMGKPFQQTKSTIGVEKFERCLFQGNIDKKQGKFEEYKDHQHEFEMLLARECISEMNIKAKAKTMNVEVAPIGTEPDQPQVSKPNFQRDSEQTMKAEILQEIENVDIGPSEDNEDTPNRTEQLVSYPSAAKIKEMTELDVDFSIFNTCLTENINQSSKLIISLYDFGGQDIFNVLHPFFMSKYGVYILAFDMTLLLSPDLGKKELCLEHLSFWMNSLAVHTYEAEKSRTARFALVGTRDDQVSSTDLQQQISDLLEKQFSNHCAWASRLVYFGVRRRSIVLGIIEKFTLNFFPVDNKSPHSLPVKSLVSNLREEIEKSDYVKREIPLIWIKILDDIKAIRKSFLPYAELQDFLERKYPNFRQDWIPALLTFYYEMGLLVWVEEPGLKDVIILDPIEYFVKPATQIICKHIATIDDPYRTKHELEVHLQAARGELRDDWITMLEYGLISERLIDSLLGRHRKEKEKILLLMHKFGLSFPCYAVHYRRRLQDSRKSVSGKSVSGKSVSSAEDGEASPVRISVEPQRLFLISALVPDNPHLLDCEKQEEEVIDLIKRLKTRYQIVQEPLPSSTSFYFAFFVNKKLFHSPLFTQEDLKEFGFLPSGFFQRFLASILNTLLTSMNQDLKKLLKYNELVVFQNLVIMKFKNRKIKFIPFLNMNLIQIEIEDLPVTSNTSKSSSTSNYLIKFHQLFRAKIKSLISECYPSLVSISLLPYFPSSPPNAANEPFLKTPATSTTAPSFNSLDILLPPLFVPLKEIKTMLKNDKKTVDLVSNGGGHANINLKEQYLTWNFFSVTEETMRMKLKRYQIFLSYRWNEAFDSDFVFSLSEFFEEQLTSIIGEKHTNRNRLNGAETFLANDLHTEEETGEVNVFLDKKKLEQGYNFLRTIVSALVNCDVIAPVISTHAIQKLLTHDPTVVDNLLLEWILALSVHYHYTTPQPKEDRNKADRRAGNDHENQNRKPPIIIPIIVGMIHTNPLTGKEEVSNFFESTFFRQLSPDIIPTATLKRAKELLSEWEINLSLQIIDQSIKKIVGLLSEQLGCHAWDILRKYEGSSSPSASYLNLQSLLVDKIGTEILNKWEENFQQCK